MSEIRRGALLSYATILVVNLSGLLLTPFIIRALGNAEYGLYVLIGSLAAYLGVLNFGLNNAVTRYVAQCAATNDRSQEARFLGAAVVVNVLAAIAVVGVGSVFYVNIDTWFSGTLDASARDQARTMLLLLIANVIFTVTASMFSAICAGHQRFVVPKAINLVRYALRIALVIALLSAEGGAVALVALDTALSLAVLFVTAFYALKNIGARFSFRSLNVALVRGVLAFSVWVFLYSIIGQVQWQSGQIIIGAEIGPEAVAIYGVGIMFGTYYGAFSDAVTGLYLPRATYMTVANADADELRAEMVRIGRIALFILLLVLGGFGLFGKEFLHLWAGPAYGQAWGIAMVIMLAYTVPLIQTFASHLLQARNLIAFKSKLYLVALPLGVVLGYFLLEPLALLGMAVGMATGWVAATVILNLYYHRVLGIDVPKFFAGVAKGIVPAFSACLVVGGILRWVPLGSGWVPLALRIVAFTLIYLVVMHRYGMNAVERQEVSAIRQRFMQVKA